MVCLLLTVTSAALASDDLPQTDPSSAAAAMVQGMRFHIPRISQVPKLEDFDGMTPHGAAEQMVELTGFIQRAPSDGAPATQKTRIFFGYDSTNLYVVWACFDTDVAAVRAHKVRRENIYTDD